MPARRLAAAALAVLAVVALTLVVGGSPVAVSWRSLGPGDSLGAVFRPQGCDLDVRLSALAQRVEFELDGRPMGTDEEPPWGCGVPRGRALAGRPHTLRATAVYPGGIRSSTAVTLRATTPPPPPPAARDVLWRGDFETGDLEQWDGVQRVARDRVEVRAAPGGRRGPVARFRVGPRDSIGDTDPRAELVKELDTPERSEPWYRRSTYFDPAFPTDRPGSYVTWTQWRAADESDSYGSFMLWGDQLQLRLDGTHWRRRLTKGEWHDVVYHVKWSPDPDVGFLELWFDGEPALPRKHMATMAGRPGRAVPNYLKQGLYKSRDIPEGVLYHDGMTVSDR